MSINRFSSRVANNTIKISRLRNYSRSFTLGHARKEHCSSASLVREFTEFSESLRILSHSLDNRAPCAPRPIRTRRSSDHDCSPSMPALQESELANEKDGEGDIVGRDLCPYHVALGKQLWQSLLYAKSSHGNAGRIRTARDTLSLKWKDQFLEPLLYFVPEISLRHYDVSNFWDLSCS